MEDPLAGVTSGGTSWGRGCVNKSGRLTYIEGDKMRMGRKRVLQCL